MSEIVDRTISCPYCGESIDVLIETLGESGEGDQEYIEDCQVCCRPISFVVTLDFQGETKVAVFHENETY